MYWCVRLTSFGSWRFLVLVLIWLIFYNCVVYFEGFALGAAIGLFAASVDPMDPDQAAKTEARAVLKDISAMFVGTECVIESVSWVQLGCT